MAPGSIQEVLARLEKQDYIADQAIATSLHLATALGRPLLIEGRAGVGKTEVANVMARVLGTNLIRLQCYEGLDVSTALYEWNYPKQLLWIKLDEGTSRTAEQREQEIFSEAFLLQRPLLAALTQAERAPVLLIDEVDRADEEFEAFLLEVLSEFQVTIPEIGTIKAANVPTVILTSNRSRDLSDALRRRCLYLWIDYPTFEKELRIVRAKVPGVSEAREAGRADLPVPPGGQGGRAGQGTRHLRDPGLGRRPGRAAPRRPGPGHGGADLGLPGEGRRGPATLPGRGHGRPPASSLGQCRTTA